MNTNNPAEYGQIGNRIVPLGMRRIALWTIQYPFNTLTNRIFVCLDPFPFPEETKGLTFI